MRNVEHSTVLSFCEKDAVEVLENSAMLNPQILIEIHLQKEFPTVFMVFNQQCFVKYTNMQKLQQNL